MSGIYTILIFFTSFTFSLLLVPLMIYLAKKKQIYDLPDKGEITASDSIENNIPFTKSRRMHTQPIPRLGGVAIVAGFFISVSIWKLPSNMALIYCCSFVMFALGLIDDIKTLTAKIRLCIQTITALTVVFFSNLQIQNITFSSDITFTIPYILGIIISTFIIIGSINSINMVDGLDGLAGGVVLIGISLLSYLHFLSTHNLNLIIVFSIPIIGAILGFLKYNTHPSSIFMGDSGSNWLGFMVGVFLILILNNETVSEHNSRWILENSTKLNYFPILSVLLCLSIPIFDTAHVIILRLIEGKNPLKADTRHFHHSLIKMGFTHAQSVIIVYFLMIFFGILGILPIAYPQYNLNWTPIVGVLLSIFCIVFSVKLTDGFITQLSSYKFFLVSNSSAGPKITLFLKYWEHLNRYTIYLILLATPFLAGVVPKTISLVAACMALIMICTIFIKKSDSFFESLLIAIASTVLLIANNSNVIWIEIFGTKYNLQHAYNYLFIWLLFSTLFFFIFTFKRKYLIIAPTDFLLAILPLILLLLPLEYQTEYKLNIIALRSLVLFAALRTLSKRHSRFFYKIHFICIIALAWIALTTLAGLRLVY
ncbi:glycosyltransferase family 4 protein [Fluviispira sanaruensis]|uniref:Undecaprenyl/decaprenyl-phosphate alpha-N-acetylglucosaminyl 1-phosphate transferase n=1 Tax=Fluviispira sanaruensis TaxID=2493639 RepID=A0A4V0P2Q4_FLUSA|nr:MraY family glycosyltransferase [Fluviispira sanaruensis]BBH54037.1 undecaprenyl/decaprenyl-phosphate alpha-N-acetylglucosaminyl 1-phosphate transferase [Fluviispira sanaruensis]